MPDSRARGRPAAAIYALGAILLLAAGWRFARPVARPHMLARVAAQMSGAVRCGGAWYWLEGAGKPGARIVRAAAGSAVPVVTADGITAFAVDPQHLVWNQQVVPGWQLRAANPDGTGP